MLRNRSEEVKILVSFKNTPEELIIYNYIKDKIKVIGQSTYIKMLVIEEMQEKWVWLYD